MFSLLAGVFTAVSSWNFPLILHWVLWAAHGWNCESYAFKSFGSNSKRISTKWVIFAQLSFIASSKIDIVLSIKIAAFLSVPVPSHKPIHAWWRKFPPKEGIKQFIFSTSTLLTQALKGHNLHFNEFRFRAFNHPFRFPTQNSPFSASHFSIVAT